MKYYLLVYDRDKGELIGGPREYDEDLASSAMRDRFAMEAEEHLRANIEVVLLGADSLDALKRTHSRYFKTASEIVETRA